MEFLRGAVTLATANVFLEAEIPTPVSRSEKLAMLIWSIECPLLTPAQIEDGQENAARVQLASESQDAIQPAEDDDILFSMQRVALQQAQGSLTEFLQTQIHGVPWITYQPPVLYTKSSLFLGLDSIGVTQLVSAVIRVGYTLERVPSDIFIAALVE